MAGFNAPHWLLLTVPLAAAGWYWRSWKLWLPRRALALTLVVLILADPHALRSIRGMDLWVLLDRSASAAAITESSWAEWRRLLEDAKPGSGHRLRVVNFAEEALEATDPETAGYAGGREMTRLGLAVETALSSLDRKRSNRILVFTDGYATEPLDGLGAKLADSGVCLDYRLIQSPVARDFRVTGLSLPERRQPGEPFLLEVAAAGGEDGPRKILISQDGSPPQAHTIQIRNGAGALRLSTRLREPGAHRFVAEFAEADGCPGNDSAEGWIEIASGPRVVLVTAYADDPLRAILESQGFAVQVVTQGSVLHPGSLSGAKALLLNNVPAYRLPAQFLSAVDFFLRQQGGGLLMIGGKQSFGAGGYFDSPLDALLPVSMELKQEHRKLAVAMSIVMDRSGSMSAQVPGGRTKMELANEGAGRAVELLGDFDQVTVHAVDSRAYEQVPLLPVGANRGRIIDLIRRIGSGGGGIFVYEGLQAGWHNLKSVPVGQRHLILFADAADSEEPGAYRELLAEMAREKCTVSVIGLGTESDSDAGLLKDIAKLGGGRAFFTHDASTLPNLFAQETVTVARSQFLDEPAPAEATGRWLEISPTSPTWLKQVDGYNLSYARPEATVALLTPDEYEAPLVSFVQRGLGRCAAVAFPLGGEFSGSARAWPGLADFLQTLVRWLAGEAAPPGIGLRTRVDGTRLRLDLFVDELDAGKLAAAPRIVLHEATAAAPRGAVREIAWERMEPGHFRADANLEPGRMVRGAIQVGKAALPFGPVSTGVQPEWEVKPGRVEELKQVSAASRGQERVQLAKAWESPPQRQSTSLRPSLLVLLLAMLLTDALLTRMGWAIPVFSPARRMLEKLRTGPAPGTKPQGPEPSPSRPEPGSGGTNERRARFDRAKRRR